MAPSRDAVDEKVAAAVGADTRSITSSCYRVYFAEFRRKSWLTMGVLPGLACASILNTNSSCPSGYLGLSGRGLPQRDVCPIFQNHKICHGEAARFRRPPDSVRSSDRGARLAACRGLSIPGAANDRKA